MNSESPPPGDNPEKPSGRSTRAAVWATVGIVVILGLAVFVVAFVVPVLRTRAFVRGYVGMFLYAPHMVRGYRALLASNRGEIEKSFGPIPPVERLVQYQRQPSRIAPEKHAAAQLLAIHEERGVHALARLLESENAGLRWLGAFGLGWCGPNAKPAVPTLRKVLLRDEDRAVQAAAAIALNSLESDKPSVPAGSPLVGD